MTLLLFNVTDASFIYFIGSQGIARGNEDEGMPSMQLKTNQRKRETSLS